MRRASVIVAGSLIAVVIGVGFPICFAKQCGWLEAQLDLSIGRLCYRVYGLPGGGSGEAEKVLMQQYGIHVQRIADCVVWPYQVENTDAYNDVVQREVVRRYERDVIGDIYARCSEQFDQDCANEAFGNGATEQTHTAERAPRASSVIP